MELTELSSNWKKLQQSLHAEKRREPERSKKAKKSQPSNPAEPASRKRKGSALADQVPNGTVNGHVAKRRKTTERPRAPHIIRKAESQSPTHPAPTGEPDGQAVATRPRPATSAPPPPVARPADAPCAGLDPDVRLGRYVAMDCEMVGVGPRPAAESALARVSLVNYDGLPIYDALVAPREAVTDFRTAVSGIAPGMLAAGGGARALDAVQRDVAAALAGRVLVGHAVHNDLGALFLSHPRRDIRDTSVYPPYRRMVGGRTPGLRRLAKELLGLDIQAGAHSSVEDARATMALFRREKDGFEKEAAKRYGRPLREVPEKQAVVAEAPHGDPPQKKAKRKTKKKKGKYA